MAFCKKCGAQVVDNTAFCASCGAPQNAAPAPAAVAGQLHCPNCKGTNLTPVVESSVDGAVTSSRGNLSATKVSSIHRNYWICSTCGNKFRNIQNLQEEMVKMEKNAKLYTIITVISAVLFFVFCKMVEEAGFLGFLFWSFVLTAGLFALVSFCFIFVSKNKAKKMKEELAYLKKNCF